MSEVMQGCMLLSLTFLLYIDKQLPKKPFSRAITNTQFTMYFCADYQEIIATTKAEFASTAHNQFEK
jgi:hypothetical protein